MNGILINFASECGSPLNSIQINQTYSTHLSQLELRKTALNTNILNKPLTSVIVTTLGRANANGNKFTNICTAGGTKAW